MNPDSFALTTRLRKFGAYNIRQLLDEEDNTCEIHYEYKGRKYMFTAPLDMVPYLFWKKGVLL